MAEVKKDSKKINPGIIVAIVIGVVAVVCVIVAIIIGNNTPKSAGIVGTWKYRGWDSSYTFNADGTCSQNFYGSSKKCTYTDDGSTLVLNFEGTTEPNTYKYRIVDDKTLRIEDDLGVENEYERQ